MDGRTLLEITGAIYDAPLTGDWRPSLQLIHNAIGATHVALMRHDGETGRQEPVGSQGPSIEARYVEQYAPLNDAWPTLARQPVGQAVLDRAVLDMPHYQSGAFFNEFARPNGLVAATGMVLGRSGGVLSALILNHAQRTAAGEQLDLELLSLLGPHFLRASLLWRERDALAAGDVALWEAVDRFAAGIMIIDRAGRVLRANTVASEFLRARSREVLERRPFAGPDVLRPAVLQKLLGRLGTIRLAAGDRDHLLRIVPLQGPPAWLGTRRSAYVVVVTDLSRAPVSAQSVLVAAFGLTRAEARVAVRLGGAGTLGDIAAGLGIRLSTARTLLGRALAKTGLHSQSELVRLVERLALVEPGASAR